MGLVFHLIEHDGHQYTRLSDVVDAAHSYADGFAEHSASEAEYALRYFAGLLDEWPNQVLTTIPNDLSALEELEDEEIWQDDGLTAYLNRLPDELDVDAVGDRLWARVWTRLFG